MSALSGFDQALWDLKGKRLGQPVWQLLGGAVRDRVQVYAWIGDDRPADVIEAAKTRQEAGLHGGQDERQRGYGCSIRRRLSTACANACRRCRASASMSASISNGRIHKPMARQVARAVEPLRPLFIEEPLLSEHIEAIEQLSKLTTTPIVLGERLVQPLGTSSRFSRRPASTSFSPISAMPAAFPKCAASPPWPKPTMSAWHRIVRSAPLALAACLQVAIATPNHVIQEMSLGIHYNTAEHDPAQLHGRSGSVRRP